ncbi:MAG: aromatic ring-hydroxylating dioxygenase subunit alpha [Pseudomonadota bacterium]
MTLHDTGLDPSAALSPALDAALEAVLRPIEAANGLPNACYTEPGLQGLERDRVFFSGWAAIGFAHQVANPGDVMPITFLGQPLLLTRDREGALHVFLNVCRHRGMILVTEAGNLPRAIRCPYHSWCYELDGRLRTTPHVGGPGTNRHECLDRASLGLVELRMAEWLGVVFVNLDGTAPEFDIWAAEAKARWAEFDRPVHFLGDESAFRLDVKTNWKLAVENYCESYHLPWVHPGLNSYSRLEDHYHIEANGFSGQGTTVYRPMLTEDGRRFPPIPGLSSVWDEAAEYIALYPNVLLGVHKDHSFAIILEPESLDSTREHIAIFYPDRAVADEAYAPMRQRNAAMWREVFEEDVFVVEGMQAGRHASGFDGGRFSPAMDGPTHAFHRWIAARLRGV